MPPKAKGGKDEKKKSDEPQVDDSAEREMVEKELVIQYLKSKLGRYQDHGDKLQVENISLTEELETQKLNLRDINEFLTNELKARSLTTSALEAKVFELNNNLEDFRKAHETAMNKLRAEKDKELETMKNVILEYEKKAKLTQDFLDRKDAMEAELHDLRETLTSKVKDYEYRLTDLDRQHIQDREKWKRETAQKIKETKIQMMKLTDNQLEMTTKRTIMENEQMSIELSYQSRQTEKLMGKNTVLMEENNDLRRQLHLSKQTEEELARRNNVYQKTIKSLLTKLREQSSAQAEVGSLASELEGRIADLESQLHLAQLQAEEQAHQLAQVTSKLEASRGELESVTASYDDTAQFLLQCMEDVKDKIITVVKPDDADVDRAGGDGAEGASGHGESPADIAVLPGRLDELSSEQRERVLAYLLEKLHVFTHARSLGGATGLGRSNSARSGHGDSGNAGGISLPPIPSFPRRNVTSTTPILHGLLPSASPNVAVLAAAAAAAGVVSESGAGASGQPLTASWPGPGAAGPGSVAHSLSGAGRASRQSGVRGSVPSVSSDAPGPVGMQQPEVVVQALPAVDELLSKVMSDVRPWGKRSQDQPLSSSRTGVFLKKGAGPAAPVGGTKNSPGRKPGK